MIDPILNITDLTIDYGTGTNVVDGVSLSLEAGHTLGLVGESGSGKSSVARAVMGLTPYQGDIEFDGREHRALTPRMWRETRRRLQMIFQDPYGTLDPRMTVGSQIAEPLVVHRMGTRAEIRVRVRELLERVGLDGTMTARYPHEFSGGQRQRIAIARAIALQPSLIVCDEPTSALDVSVQAQVLALLESLQRDHGIAYLFIAHNLGVVRRMATHVAVMHRGVIVEHGPTHQVFTEPQDPYTRSLLDAVLEPVPTTPPGDGEVK